MMARSSKAPTIGRIQMRKTNLPNHHFRLATRGRSIQMCQEPTSADEEVAYCTLVALVSMVMLGSIVSVPSTLNPIWRRTSST